MNNFAGVACTLTIYSALTSHLSDENLKEKNASLNINMSRNPMNRERYLNDPNPKMSALNLLNKLSLAFSLSKDKTMTTKSPSRRESMTLF
jgi:hypothetical protein